MSIWNPSLNWNAPLTRRAALRGAGAVLALPFLESWASRLARGAGVALKTVRPPLRMAIYSVTGGTVVESWKMPKAGPFGEKLPSILRALEPFRNDLLVLTGLSHGGESENLNGHEHCAFKHLTGAPKAGKLSGRPYASISVDQAAARAVGEATYLPSMEFGLSNQETRYSFRSANEQVPYEPDPRLVFDRMFRGRPPIVPNWQRRAAAKAAKSVRDSAGNSYDRSVLDSVREEAKSLRGQLGGADRERLDRYLDTVRSVETKIDRLEAVLKMEAADAKDPGPSKLVKPALRDRKESVWTLIHGVYRDPEFHADYIRVMSDLLVMALQTDTTRVATVALGDDGAMFPGVVTVGYEYHCHTLEHQGNAGRPEDADPIAREALRQIHAWYTSLFAETVRKMKEIDEGGSSLLDNTMLLYTSYMADGGHGTQDYPALLVGGAQGTLKGGRQIDYPKRTPMSNLFVEMLDRMGAPVKEFGESAVSKDQRFNGRLPGLV
jgi:Protein of unknown function (DUF1552)